MAVLEILLAGGRNRRVALTQPVTSIGGAAGSDLYLDDPLVAPCQARIEWTSGEHRVVVLDTGRPVYRNGAPLTEPAILVDGDMLIFGSTRCRYLVLAPDVTQGLLEISLTGTQSPLTARVAVTPASAHPIAGVSAAPTKPDWDNADFRQFPWLEIQDGGGASGRVPLKAVETLLGSAGESTVPLRAEGVEHRHAKLVRAANTVQLIDLESRVGVFVNGRRVLRETLKAGDIVRLGGATLVLHNPLPDRPPSPPLEASPAPTPSKRWRLPIGLLVLAGVGLLLLLGLTGALIWRATRPTEASPDPEGFRAQVTEWFAQRRWSAALERLEALPPPPVPEEERARMASRAASEASQALVAAEIERCLATGDVETALQLQAGISPESVYHSETARAVMAALESSVRALVAGPPLDRPGYELILRRAAQMTRVEPESLAGLSLGCLALLGLDQLPELLAEADRLTSAHPTAVEGYLYRGEALLRLERLPEAAAAADEAVQQDPNQPEALLLRARLAIRRGRLTDARLDLGQVLQIDPNHQFAQSLLGMLTGARARGAEEGQVVGRPPVRPGATVAPTPATGRQRAAAARLTTAAPGSPPQAYAEWRQEAVSLEESNPGAAIARWENLRRQAEGAGFRLDPADRARVGALLTRLADQDLNDGQLDRAWVLATRALVWQPDLTEAIQIRQVVEDAAGTLYQEGFRLLQHGNPADARLTWQRVLRTVGPSSPWYRKASEKLVALEDP